MAAGSNSGGNLNTSGVNADSRDNLSIGEVKNNIGSGFGSDTGSSTGSGSWVDAVKNAYDTVRTKVDAWRNSGQGAETAPIPSTQIQNSKSEQKETAPRTAIRSEETPKIGSMTRMAGNMPASEPVPETRNTKQNQRNKEQKHVEQSGVAQSSGEKEKSQKNNDSGNQLSGSRGARSSRKSNRSFIDYWAQQHEVKRGRPRSQESENTRRKKRKPSSRSARKTENEIRDRNNSIPDRVLPKKLTERNNEQENRKEDDHAVMPLEVEQTDSYKRFHNDPIHPAYNHTMQDGETIDDFEDLMLQDEHEREASSLPNIELAEYNQAPDGIYDQQLRYQEDQDYQSDYDFDDNAYSENLAREAFQRAKDLQENDYAAIEGNKVCFESPLPIENCHLDHRTQMYEFTDEVNDALTIVGNLYGLDPHSFEDYVTISNLIRLATGLGVDMNGNILGTEYEQFVLNESNVKQACLLITASQHVHGHPFGLTPANATVSWGGSNRYPVGCIDIKMAEALRSNPASCLHSMPAANLQMLARDTWKESVQPTLAEHCASTGNIGMCEQWASIEHMIMAMCEMGGMDSNDWNVCPYSERRLSSLARANMGFPDVIDDDGGFTVNEERTARGNRNFEARQAKKYDRPDAAKTADWIFSRGGAVIRGARIALDIPLFASAEAEHLINNAETTLIDNIIYGRSKFRPTKEMLDIAASRSFMEPFTAITALREAGGWDAVEAFRASGWPATKASILAWAKENTYSYEPKHKPGKVFDSLADAVEDMYKVLLVGDVGFDKADSRLFIKSLMAEQARRNGVKASDIERLMRANPGQFALDVLGTAVGKDAYVSTKALYGGRISPLPELLKSQLEKNGFTDFAVATIMQSRFVQYGLKAFELWLPFSNTISLAVAKGLAVRNVDGSVDWMETAVGGSSETMSAAFSKAILYDCVKLGQNTLQTMFFCALITMCGGIQPPEDEKGEIDMDKFYLPWEWTIKFPWMKHRVPVRQNWFSDDILQGSAVASVALVFALQAQTTDYPVDDPYLAAGRMMWNGVDDIMGSNQVFEVGGIIFDLVGCGMDIYHFVNGEDAALNARIEGLLEGVEDFSPTTFIVSGLAQYVNSSTPLVASDIYPWFWSDDYARNYFENKDGTSKSDKDIAWNKYAVNNPIMSWVGNLVKPKTFGRKYSNYQYASDPTADKYVEKYSYKHYCEKYGLEDSKESQYAYAKRLLDIIDKNGGAEKALENGILIECGDYKIVQNYLNKRVAAYSKRISRTNEAYYNGEISKDDLFKYRDHYYTKMYEAKDILNSFKYEDLVYDKDVYIEVAGTYVRNPETGEWYNYGDKKGDNWLSPFFSPQTKTPGKDYMSGHWGTEIGNDFQTNSFLEDSDSSESMLTSGARNLVANKKNKNVEKALEEGDSLIEEWEKVIDALKKKDKEDDEKNKKNNYYNYGGGRRYGGGGGGGSSYHPKIYSNPAHMNSPKASTMYSKIPNNTYKRYLNPTVYTQGSRSPYSRRDS